MTNQWIRLAEGLCVTLPVLCALWLAAIGGRRKKAGIADFDGFCYAHRGLHKGKNAPENSLTAFQRAAERGYGSELDVHLLSDGELAVMHDHNLLRTAGADVCIEDLSSAELSRFRLKGNGEPIPLLQDVLAVYEREDCRAPLLVELKTAGSNYAALCQKTCGLLDRYPGRYMIESFDPSAVFWLRRHRPDIVRGQLSTNFFHEKNELSVFYRFAATFLLANWAGRPDFIAYRFSERRNASNWLCLQLWKLKGASWTIRTQEELEIARREGLWPIFEGFEP